MSQLFIAEQQRKIELFFRTIRCICCENKLLYSYFMFISALVRTDYLKEYFYTHLWYSS